MNNFLFKTLILQPSRNIQEMLFNRIAHNYVKMLFTTPVTQYRDKFLKVFAK